MVLGHTHFSVHTEYRSKHHLSSPGTHRDLRRKFHEVLGQYGKHSNIRDHNLQKEPVRGQPGFLRGIVGGVEDLRTHTQFEKYEKGTVEEMRG